MTWYKTLNFAKNPLDIRPNPNVIGLKEEEKALINHINRGDICFINGLTGSGKTSLLHRVQKKLKDHSFIYLDANELPQNFNLEEELKSKRSIIDKLVMRAYPKEKQVLIIDEFQSADENLILNAKTKWELPRNRALKSIVIAQIGKQLKNCADSFKERVGNRKISLRELDKEGLKELLIKRLGNKKTRTSYAKIISEASFDIIVTASGRNPRRFLEYTDLLFDYHHRKYGRNNPIITQKGYLISGELTEQILKAHEIIVEKGLRKKASKKVPKEFSERFSDFEKKMLFYLKDKARTEKEVAGKLKVSESYSKRCLNILHKQNLIMSVGNKNKHKLWQITPEARRIMVEV